MPQHHETLPRPTCGFLSRDGMPPAEFLAVDRAEVARYGVEFIENHAVGIDPGFLVRLGTARC